MIKRRFFKIDHGDKDGSDPSSSSSDEDYDNQGAEVSHDSDSDNDNDDEVNSVSSGYKSEESSGNDIEANSIEANSVEANSAGLLFSEDDAGTINEREMLINKEMSSESDSEKPNVVAETKPLPADIPTTYVLKFKSVFKCRICPRIICLTEDTLRNHLQSKRHARSEKLHREGRLKAILNSDGEIEDLELSENETEDSEDNTKKNDKGPKLHKKKFKKNKKEVAEIQTEDTEDNTKKNEKGSKLHKKRLRNKKSDNGNSRKMRSAKGSSKRSRRK